MEKPYWLKLALAIYGLCLFMGDTGSDLYVGISLHDNCHHFYASCVFTFMFIPGFILGFYNFVCNIDFANYGDNPLKNSLQLVFGAPLFASLSGLLYIPFGIGVLIWSAIDVDSSDREETAKK